MPSKISKSEKQQLRKQCLLRSAQRLAREQGYLTLNVAEVAKQSKVSIGTLYSHFENKEGLVAALAVHSLQGRLATFQAVRQIQDLECDERLLAIVFADFLFSIDHPELLAAEQLGASTAILREMPGGLFQWVSGKELERVSPVQTTAEEAIQSGRFKAWKSHKSQAAAMDCGIWTLVAGSSYIWNVRGVIADDLREGPSIPDWLKKNLCALFIGYGWTSEQPEKDVDRIAKFCTKSCRRLAGDCCV